MMAHAPAAAARWDLFCKVVDNFGDAGIAWRLARQLAGEHGLEVTLWIDEPAALRCIGGIDPCLAVQSIAGVVVRRTSAWQPCSGAAQVVVEILGCGLPPGYLEAMLALSEPPRWFVLEYLSAEAWIDEAHGLPSPHPATGLERQFWFPGFSVRSGGLLRERDLFARRRAFAEDDARRHVLWRALRVAPLTAGTLRISMFAYAHSPLRELLDVWADGDRSIACFVPEGVADTALARWAGRAPGPGSPVECGALKVHVVPFVEQDRYDELLWACDLNFVRGEDSFVRAQWAALPFVWHIYAQAENAHGAKLGAFLNRYEAGLTGRERAALEGFWMRWNGFDEGASMRSRWSELAECLPALTVRAREWARHLASLPSLSATLVSAAGSTV